MIRALQAKNSLSYWSQLIRANTHSIQVWFAVFLNSNLNFLAENEVPNNPADVYGV